MKWDSFLTTDDEVAIKLRELDEISRSLNDVVVELKGETAEASEDLSIEDGIPDWKDDVINPPLGNFPY